MNCIRARRPEHGGTLWVWLACWGMWASCGFGQAIPRLDGSAALELLKKQCAFGPRVPGTEAHQRARDFLAAKLREYSANVTLQSFPYKADKKTLTMSNIVATFGNAQEAGVLLCAHWDTRPFADQETDPKRAAQPILGANDGASGVAVLLEIARRLHAVPPPVPVVIVLFDGEDWGRSTETMFIGSRYYAMKPIPRKPKYGILLDMVGDADLQIPIEQFSWQGAKQLVTALWDAADALDIREFQRRVGGAIADDHLPLLEAGIPCVDLIDFEYPYWHRLTDTPDKCSAESLRKVGDVVLRFLYTRPQR